MPSLICLRTALLHVSFSASYRNNCSISDKISNSPIEPNYEAYFRSTGLVFNSIVNDSRLLKAHVPGRQTKRHLEKGGKLNTSQAGSVAASRAAVGQFLSISREAFILRTRYITYR